MEIPKQKTWVTSIFSQLAHLENNCTSKRKRPAEDIAKPIKRTTRKNHFTVQLEEDKKVSEAKTNGSNESMAKHKNPLLKEEMANTNNENWIDLFAPTNSEELAIHPKKIQEIQNWFQHCAVIRHKNPAQLCLLTGPSGCGKTAAVRVLAKENNIIIQEWINPVDQEIIYSLGDQYNKSTYFSSQLDTFKNFLFEASRYPSLLNVNSTKKCLIMVEDYPNFLLRDPAMINDILEDYMKYAKSPIIFIVTDAKTRNLNISYNIFTEQIRQKFSINHISLNAIASSIMQKSMKRFCSLMHSSSYHHIYKSPPQQIVESIIISAQGDIRNALINLHFSSLRGAPNVLTKGLKNEEAKTLKRKSECKLKSLGRDESITMMHALGRVFNPKITEDNKRFLHSPEELAEAFATEPKKFIDLVEANYIGHFRDIEYLLEAINGLSICDVILNEYRDDALALTGLNIGIRSVMVANKNPATVWMPIKGQKRVDVSKTKMLQQSYKVLPEHHNISTSLYALDYKTFVNVISSKAHPEMQNKKNLV